MSRQLRQSSDTHTKLGLRGRLLMDLGETDLTSPDANQPEPPIRVLETHTGAGDMSAAYQSAQAWLGVDLDKRYPQAIHCDSRYFLRAVDLDTFNLFDVDAYGSPLEFVWLVSQRRRAKTPIAFALTSGAFAGAHRARPNLRDAGFSRQLLAALGNPDPASLFAGVWKDEHALLTFRACFEAWFPEHEIKRLEITPGYKPGTKNDLICWYVGCYLEPRDNASVAAGSGRREQPPSDVTSSTLAAGNR